ncbi:MAG: VCBS domain-containing protein, partial [Rubrivivax sp.]
AVAGLYGSLSIDAATGQWTYTLDNSAANALADGEQATDTFTVRVQDAEGAYADQTVTLTLTGSNDSPVITVADGDSDAASLVVADGSLLASGRLTVTDPDANDTIQSAVTAVVLSGTVGDLTSVDVLGLLQLQDPPAPPALPLEPSVTWRFDATGQLFAHLSVGESLSLRYTVTSTDTAGAQAQHEVTINIRLPHPNRPPVLMVDATGPHAVEDAVQLPDTAVKTSGQLSITDDNIQDIHSLSTAFNDDAVWTRGLSSEGGTPAGELTLVAPALLAALASAMSATATQGQGQWLFSVDNTLLQFLQAGEFVEMSFDITVDDGSGMSNATATQTVMVRLEGRADAPVVTVVDAGNAVVEDQALSSSGRLGITDADHGESAFVPLEVAGVYGTLRLQADGHWHYQAGETAAQQAALQGLGKGDWQRVHDEFDVASADGQTLTPLRIEVLGANDAPVLTVGPASNLLLEAGSSEPGVFSATRALSSTDVDVGDSLRVDATAMAAAGWTEGTPGQWSRFGTYGTATLDAATMVVSYRLDDLALATERLDDADRVEDRFVLHLQDGASGGQASVQAEASFALQGSNDEPLRISPVTVASDGVRFTVVDVDAADSLTLALSGVAGSLGLVNNGVQTHYSPVAGTSVVQGALLATDGSMSAPLGLRLMLGTQGNDAIVAGSLLPNVLYGFGGNDALSGRAGVVDHLFGGEGNDTFRVADASDWVHGGTGIDTLVVAASYTSASDEQLTDVETITVSMAGRTLNLSNQTEGFSIKGSTGVDIIIGGQGADRIAGGAGADTLWGGDGADTFVFANGASRPVVGGSGSAGTVSGFDVIQGFAAEDTLEIPGATVAAASVPAGVDGVDSTLLTDSGQTIKSHYIDANGLISFDDSDAFASALSVSSSASIAAVLQYLQLQDLGDAGTTVMFASRIGDVDSTWVFTQGTHDGLNSADTLVQLSGYTGVAGLSTEPGTGAMVIIDPIPGA